MASSVSQINVRVDTRLKQAGDEGMSDMGITSSEAVRALWGKFAQGREGAEDAVEFLFGDPAGFGGQAASEARLEAFERGQFMVSAAMAKLGLDPGSLIPMGEDELEGARLGYLTGKY